MIIPYRMETTFARYPITNIVIIAFTSVFHFLVIAEIIPSETSELLVLQEWNLGQLMGNVFLHGDIFHLLGNMLFLWIFGNAVCALVGNLSYFFIYIFLGICASGAHMFFNGYPAIGASGAINGIVGMTLIFFPVNKLHSFFLFSFPWLAVRAGKFEIKTYWMILYWFVFDIAGVVFGGGNIAYWAHIGGFITGLAGAFILLKLEVFETYDPTIVDVIKGNDIERETMTLEEFEEMEKMNQLKKPTVVPDAVAIKLPSDNLPDPHHDVNPVFRILKVGRKDNEVTCYFINEGEKISNVVVQTSYAAEIQPQVLDAKTPGWIRFTVTEDFNLDQIQFDIAFDANSQRLQKLMKYNSQLKKFIVE